MSNITALPRTKSPNAPKATKPASRQFRNRMRRQGAAAIAIGAVATTLTALSLSHLAHGISIVTGAPGWEAWAMAVGVDVAMIGSEMTMLTTATESVRAKIRRWANGVVIGTLAGSAIMNAFAFSALASGWLLAPAIVMGLAIPALIYCLTRICATLYIDCHSRG